MCSWGLRCNEINLCTAASEVLGCAKAGSSCDTCAMGFLSVPVPKVKALHKSKYATIGKLVPYVGWKITRPGVGSDLEAGDIVTHLNEMPLNVDKQEAAKAIVGFYDYEGASVVINLLSVNAFRLQSREYERV